MAELRSLPESQRNRNSSEGVAESLDPANEPADDALSGGIPPVDVERIVQDAVAQANGADPEQRRLDIQVAQAEAERDAAFRQEVAERQAALDKLPDDAGSFVPLFGPARDSAILFSEGQILLGTGAALLAASDIGLVKSLVVGGGKAVLRTGGKEGVETLADDAAEVVAKGADNTASSTDELAVVNAQAGDAVVDASAEALARESGEQLVDLEFMAAVNSGDRLSLVAHGNRTSLGGRSADELADVVNASGIQPSAIDLFACKTGCGVFGANLASRTSSVVRAPLGNVNILGGVRGVPQVRLPGSRQLLPPGQGFRVHLPVVR